MIDEEKVDDLDEASEIIPYTYSITSYGADYPVDSLVKRLEANDILVPTFKWKSPEETEIVGLQREYVWPRPKADRFIESLLLGLAGTGYFSGKGAVRSAVGSRWTSTAFHPALVLRGSNKW